MLVAAVSTSLIYSILAVIIIVAFLVWQLITVLRRNQAATLLDEDDFKAGMHRAQVIDLREPRDFKAGHILGARNMPYSTLKSYYMQLRTDLPVYMYDQGKTLSTRGAILLHKKGFKELYILKTGYNRWEGKTKKSN